MGKKSLILGYGLFSYVFFLGTLVYVIGFLTGLGVPRHINNGMMGEGFGGYFINALLLTLFAVQHTIMARPAFKKWWTSIIPEPMERSTYVLVSSVILVVLAWQWRAFPSVIWDFESVAIQTILTFISLAGFGLVVFASFLIDHFDLFGVRQVSSYFRGVVYTKPKFATPWLYLRVRHPLMLGFLIGFWTIPTMTVGSLFFAVLATGYIFVGIQFEEKDNEKSLGEPYLQYKSRTSMILPMRPSKGKDGDSRSNRRAS